MKLEVGSTDKDLDIVAEYVEPEPQQPLRWVECKPDKPGIWARQHGSQMSISVLYPDNWDTFDKATRCYLGPVPEILPPVKKVVERLWLKYAGTYGDGAQRYIERWICAFDEPTEENPGDWIRTDRTREREI